MATTGIDPNLNLINGKNNAPTKATGDRQKLADDFDDFLLLLTTQLKNQDPTQPLDTNQFTQQLVMFSEVEQSVATNENLENLLGVFNNLDSGVNYLGQTVEAKGNAGFLVNKNASFVYSLPAGAADVSVVISDADGRAVFSGKGPTTAGKNIVSWDGVNSFNSKQEPDGDYYINIVAKDSKGETIDSDDVTTYTNGVVTSAQMEDGQLMLTIGNLKVPLSDVMSVRLPSQVAAAQ